MTAVSPGIVPVAAFLHAFWNYRSKKINVFALMIITFYYYTHDYYYFDL